MDQQEAIMRAQECLEMYLEQKGINPRKKFHCLNPAHADTKPSMVFFEKANRVYCFSCGCRMDIFDLVGQDYGISGFLNQLNKVCDLFSIDYHYSKSKKKKVKNPIIPLTKEERDLIGIGWSNSNHIPYTATNLTSQRPEDKRLPQDFNTDLYIDGEILNGGSFWMNLVKDRDTYEWMVRGKCREKYWVLEDCISSVNKLIASYPDNKDLLLFRKSFEDLQKQVLEIFVRFKGKTKKTKVSA